MWLRICRLQKLITLHHPSTLGLLMINVVQLKTYNALQNHVTVPVVVAVQSTSSLEELVQESL